MFSFHRVQNLSEFSRKYIALGVAFILTFFLAFFGRNIGSFMDNDYVFRQQEQQHEIHVFFEEGEAMTSDILFHVWLGWDDISRKVFSN
jgi:hypothetical protein